MKINLISNVKALGKKNIYKSYTTHQLTLFKNIYQYILFQCYLLFKTYQK